tara:strand:+ start:3261 stop:3452 length:192 start_codon:yes stop_codon:yes gene_type:complete
MVQTQRVTLAFECFYMVDLLHRRKDIPLGQQLLTEFVVKVAIARARSEARAARQQRAVDGDGI